MNNYIETKVGKHIVRNHIDGSEFWFLNGNYHREDGPAVKWANGSEMWWLNGKRHREDGPAIKYPNGTKAWYKNGKLHREDGPAIKYSTTYQDYYLNNECLLQEEYKLVSILYRMNIIYE